MNKGKLRDYFPTLPKLLEKRRRAKENLLPKHLRPRPVWPIGVQVLLNVGLLVTLYNMMIDRDDYASEAAPAIVLVICLLLLIYTFLSAVRLKHRYAVGRGRRLAKLNVWLMVLSFLTWCGSILVFLS